MKAQNKQKSTWAEWGRVGSVLSNVKDHQKWFQQAYRQAVSVLNLAQKHQGSKALNNVQQQFVKDQKSLTASLDILDAMNHDAQGNNKYQEALKTLKNAQANNDSTELPQTSNGNDMTLIGLGLVGAMMSMFGLRRRHE